MGRGVVVRGVDLGRKPALEVINGIQIITDVISWLLLNTAFFRSTCEHNRT